MRTSIFFLVASLAFVSTLPVEDEDINNPGYFLYQRPDGLIQVENLTGTVENIFASEETITFYVSTQQNRVGVRIKESQIAHIPKLTGWSNRRNTLLIVHGWTNNHESPVNDIIKTAALQKHDINVLVVDWSPIAGKNYISAQGSVLKVGKYVGEFLVRMEKELHLDLSTVTLVGHSLGAHVAGNAGAATGGRVGKIVGLDPAGPLFSEKNTKNRLNPTDAKFVQVIHTNNKRLGFGIIMGHADYYPNGGNSQPGCGLDITGSCAHSRAYEYFSESLNNDNFWARICDSQSDLTNGKCSGHVASQMGGLPASRVHGKFYLSTNSASPFAQGFR